MSDEAALLKTIIASPDDDTPRLAHANYRAFGFLSFCLPHIFCTLSSDLCSPSTDL
jgi:hypothetical protein